MNVSVIIVNYNVKEYIISCIDSIYKHSQSDIKFEIIVIDNNSFDASGNELESKFPEITIVKNDFNAGFSRAVNQGAILAKVDFLYILNPDTLFTDDSLFKLTNKSKSIDNLGVMGPSLFSESGLKHSSAWRFPKLLNTILSIFNLDFLNFYKNYKDKRFDELTQVDSLSGGAFFVSKKMFNKLGGFNQKLFWMEDVDFCLRVKEAGYSNYCFPKTKVIHYIGKSSKTNLKISISNQLISKIKFFKIHHSNLSAFLIQCSVLIALAIKSILFIPLLPLSKLYRSKIIAFIFTFKEVLIKKY